MAKEIVLKRRGTGKAAARDCRKNGLVPAVVYGKAIEPQVVCLDATAVKQIMTRSRGHVHRVVASDPSFEGNVMVQDVSYDPLTGAIRHVDLHRISLTDKVKTEVVLDVVGESGLEKRGLLLQRQSREVSVECLPADIPASIPVDVSDLGAGDTVTAADLKISENVRLVTNLAEVLLVVIAPKVSEEVEEEEGAVEGEAESEAEPQ